MYVCMYVYVQRSKFPTMVSHISVAKSRTLQTNKQMHIFSYSCMCVCMYHLCVRKVLCCKQGIANNSGCCCCCWSFERKTTRQVSVTIWLFDLLLRLDHIAINYLLLTTYSIHTNDMHQLMIATHFYF